jgi:psiF repeat
MKELLSLIALGLALTSGLAQAQEKAQEKAKTPQQNKMAMCNKEATGKTGDDRKAFMKTCLSAGKGDAQQGKAKS